MNTFSFKYQIKSSYLICLCFNITHYSDADWELEKKIGMLFNNNNNEPMVVPNIAKRLKVQGSSVNKILTHMPNKYVRMNPGEGSPMYKRFVLLLSYHFFIPLL